ncbi:MAG: maleate cis-trans isomerase family protein [Burkholderiales bacterium]
MFQTTAATTRIGLLVPSSNAVMEVEFYRSLPADITVHTSHIYRASAAVDAQAMAETGRNAAQTALSLSQTQLALIVYGHTASSYVNGPAGDADIERMVADAVGVSALTTARAAVRCLRSVGAQRVWLAAPYPMGPTRSAAEFLSAHGFEVVSIACLGVAHGPDLKHVTLQAAYDVGLRAAATGDADALFMSGTGVHTIGIVGALEKALGKPVITANLAALWGALDQLGRADRFSFGESRLLQWQRARGAAS